jgi:hypothetical protein
MGIVISILTALGGGAQAKEVVDQCRSVFCSGRGTCVPVDDQPTCRCDEGYRPDPDASLSCVPIASRATAVSAAETTAPARAVSADEIDRLKRKERIGKALLITGAILLPTVGVLCPLAGMGMLVASIYGPGIFMLTFGVLVDIASLVMIPLGIVMKRRATKKLRALSPVPEVGFDRNGGFRWGVSMSF